MAERVQNRTERGARTGNELEALAKPLLAAIAIVRRLPAIELPADDDGRDRRGNLSGWPIRTTKNCAAPVISTERFVRALTTLEESMQQIADRVPWHRRGLGS